MEPSIFKSYLKLSACIALMIAGLIKIDAVLSFLGRFLSVLSPLFIGVTIAFVVNGPFEWLRRGFSRILRGSRHEKLIRVASALLAHIMLLLVLTGMFYYIVPQFIDSVKQFSANYPMYRDQVESFVKALSGYLKVETLDLSRFDSFVSQLPDRITTYLTGIVPKVFSITTSVIASAIDLVLGLVLSVYILSDKPAIERMLSGVNRAYLTKSSGRVEEIASLVSATFKKFVYGQLTEALILSILCFLGMTLFGFPYAIPISIMIGASNLIPIAGPIIGTIPSALILLLVDPAKALWFILFIVVLQQIEGNIIYPRVVGQSIGLPPLWLLMTIIVGGGLFGILGMVLGVPVATVLYQLLNRDLAGRSR